MKRVLVGVAAALAAAGCAQSATTAAALPQDPAPRVRPAPTDGICRVSRIASPDHALGDLRLEEAYRLDGAVRGFGGLSGLEAGPGGALFAIADKGAIVRIEPRGDAGAPFVCAMAPLRDADGQGLADKERGDSEGAAFLEDGRLAISFERAHRIETFALNADGFEAATRSGFRADAGTIAFDNPRLEENRGLEALTQLPSGALLAGAESPTLLGAPHPVWRLAPDPETGGWTAPGAPAFEIRTEPGFGLVGFDVTPRGDVVVLERFFTREFGNRMKISLIDRETAETGRGAILARELGRFASGGPLPIDNFEGITAVEGAAGRTDVWIVSDDNFPDAQATLLYRFSFDEAALAGSAVN